MFEVNQNGSAVEKFVLLQSMRNMSGQLCNVTANQLNGYMAISVFDLEADGVSLSPVAIAVETSEVESAVDFTAMTGCPVQQQGDWVAHIMESGHNPPALI